MILEFLYTMKVALHYATKALQNDLLGLKLHNLYVYKVDQFTIDRIDMEIVYGDKAFTISEELPGWYQFVLKTKEIFDTIPKDWDITIIKPAFATNFATIYDKAKINQEYND